ncbi:MAG: hypothetical protein ACREO8_11315 [Luteimonas sp.]
MRFIDREEVARRLSYDLCIPIVRDAMIAFSKGETKQSLRQIMDLTGDRFFGVMPGAMLSPSVFGAKLMSVFLHNPAIDMPFLTRAYHSFRRRNRHAGLRC